MILYYISYFDCHLFVFVFTGLQTVQYDRIVRWWSSNLGQRFLYSYILTLVIITYYSPTRTTYISRFYGSYYSPPPSYRSPISSVHCRHFNICTPAPRLLSWSGTFTNWTYPTPATRHPPPLVSAPQSACLLLPPRPAYIRPPLPSSACSQVSVSPRGF